MSAMTDLLAHCSLTIITINGDVQAKGNINTSGRFKVVGALYAGGSISTQGSVEISGASHPNTPNITVPTVDMNWLKSHASLVINVPLGARNYDVTWLNLGSGDIVYLAGGPIQFKGHVNQTRIKHNRTVIKNTKKDTIKDLCAV